MTRDEDSFQRRRVCVCIHWKSDSLEKEACACVYSFEKRFVWKEIHLKRDFTSLAGLVHHARGGARDERAEGGARQQCHFDTGAALSAQAAPVEYRRL